MNDTIKSKIEAAANEYCDSWPTELYHPNDLHLFFEKGASLGIELGFMAAVEALGMFSPNNGMAVENNGYTFSQFLLSQKDSILGGGK